MSRPSENRVRVVVHVRKETERLMRKLAKEHVTLGRVVDWWAAGSGPWGWPMKRKVVK